MLIKQIWYNGKIISKKIPNLLRKNLFSTNLKFSPLNNQMTKFFHILNSDDKNKNTPNNVEDKIKEVLKEIKYESNQDIIQANIIQNIRVDSDKNKIQIFLNLSKDYRKLKHMIEEKLFNSGLATSKESIEILISPQGKKSQPIIKKGLQKVKNVIAVSSCKGGVGKSTIAVNLAFSLSEFAKKKVGIFDADIYGPSLPTLINPKDATLKTYEDNKSQIIPIEFHNIKAMSFGFAAPGQRAVLRGPIISNLVTSLISDTDWGELDFLIVDMPPGTGDIQISLCQEIKFSGAVIVTTPQKLSFIDVVKGMEMFDELKIPILSVVENMAFFICDKCDEKHYVFGQGYASMLQKQFGIESSFSLPLEPLVSRVSDAGSPYVLISDTGLVSDTFKAISKELVNRVENIQKLIQSKPKLEYNAEQNMMHLFQENEEKGEVRTIKKITPFELRRKCICAACIDEYTGNKLLKDKQIPKDIHPVRIEDKGNYAVAVVWSDGHRSSIYPYKRLLADDIPGEI
jgi:Mrp family chromosome partitioning ATPase/DUF971 family protein